VGGIPVSGRAMTKRYAGGVWALQGVTIDIDEGQITALVGPNGAGKTTLLKTLLGFERLTSGAATVFGADPWRERETALSRIGYVPQATALYDGLTVDDHLGFAKFLRRTFDVDLAKRRLADVGVPLDAVARRLSGGQQAQLVLAIALATHADLLLLDEPLASLDPLARREFIQALLRSAHADHSTVLLTSHIVTDVEEACSHVAILGAGRLLLHGSIEDVKARHSVTERPHPDSEADLVGTFLSGKGQPRFLYGRDAVSAGEQSDVGAPSLEDVVLGHLASIDSKRTGRL
jgi:ABC-2 type transport system ATP-binding protein